MAAETVSALPVSERRRIVRWRAARLVEAGFDEPLASALGSHPAVDVHELLNLVDRGCSPALAARIMAPLDFGTDAA